MAEEKTIIINVETGNAEKDIKKINKEIENLDNEAKKSSESVETLKGSIDKTTGGAISRFKGLAGTLKSVSSGFKTLRGAIIASGIGALLIAITSIIAAFKSSEEGQNKFAKLMAVIGSVVDNVIDVFASLGEIIIGLFSGESEAIKAAKSFGKKLFDVVGLPIKTIIDTAKTLASVLGALFSGDIEGAFNSLNQGVKDITGNFTEAGDAIMSAKDTIVDFGKEAANEAKLAAKVADDRAKADKIDRDLLVERARLENEIAQLRLQSREEEKFNAKERASFLKEAQKLEDSLLEKEKESLKLRADAVALENTFARSTKENLDAEAEAQAKLLRVQAARTNAQRQTQRELNRLNREIAAEARARAKEEEDRQKKLEEDNKKRLESIAKIREKFVTEQENLEDQTEEQKLARQRERAQAELDQLIGTETEKRQAQIELDTFFDNKEIELRDKKNKALEQKNKESRERDAEEEKRIAAVVAQAKLDIQNAELDNIAKGIGIAKGLFEKNKALQAAAVVAENAVGVARILINTQAANAKVGAKYAGIPGGAALAAAEISANKINAALGIATSIKATLKATGILGKSGGATGGQSVPSGGAGGGQEPQAPAFNLIGQAGGVNQIEEGLQQEQTPIQAFVVSGDVSSAQELDRNIIDSATIG
jgi:hypothetical protein